MMIFVIWLANLNNKVDMRKILVEFRGQNGFYKAHFGVGWQWVNHEDVIARRGNEI